MHIKFDHNSYIEISLIKEHFGSDISKILLTIREITVCNTTSKVGRVIKSKYSKKQ